MHGIQTEDSDLRVHVSVATKRVYVFPTRNALDLPLTSYPIVPVFTGAIKTAEGYLIPVRDIPGCKDIAIPDDLFQSASFSKMDNTSQKGWKAVEVVTKMLNRGLLPIDLVIEEVDDKAMQIKGTDIIVQTKVKIQVKCDWQGGPKQFGGSGNLFLQVAECNPLRMW